MTGGLVRIKIINQSKYKEKNMKRKIIISLAGILMATNVALAEESGWFVGGQVGYDSFQEKRTGAIAQGVADYKKSGWDFSFGLLGGYKQFFTNEFGTRYYGVFNYANYDSIPTYYLNANIDLLYNFAKIEFYEFGVFGGLSLGYQHYDFSKTLENSAKGFDVGINLGARVGFVDRHNIEFYSRFGLNDVSAKMKKAGFVATDHAVRQLYAVGLRYTYSF